MRAEASPSNRRESEIGENQKERKREREEGGEEREERERREERFSLAFVFHI